VSDADIGPDDSAFDVVMKVAYQEARAVEETARALDLVALDAVVAAIRDAARIDIFGVGSSGLTAQDLQQKLHRIGLSSYSWGDPHLALTSVARGAGATTVAITNFPESPLGRLADLVLTTSSRESRYRSGAMSSRIAQLALVDFLTVRLLQGGYEQANESLRLTYDAVQNHRLHY